ncbi:MAG TPA: helix-turn-helix transcriptional regulator, partial [Acidobacteriota bacterium]|nr:helix-turn-helix transcriptional regulator [Acidobacteriota bacterium]
MNSPTKTLGEQVRRQRQRGGMTCKQVAAIAGIARGSYACLEGGYYRWNVDTLLRVQLVLRVPIQDLWPFVIAPLTGDVTDATLEAECRKARLCWTPDAQWVLDQTAAVCQVPLRVLTKAD